MKNFLIALLIVASSAQALAKTPDLLGIYVIGILTNNLSKSESKQKNFIDAVSPSGDYRVIRNAIAVNGTETYLSSWTSSDGVYIADVATFCAAKSGLLETIDVRGVTYDACKISGTHEGQTFDAWYTKKVPFGVVKEIAVANPTEPDPFIQTYEVTEFGVK